MVPELFPESDGDFAVSAKLFANHLRREPERFRVPIDVAQKVCEAIDAYLAAYQANAEPYTKSMQTRVVKDMRRAEAEKQMRLIANVVRVNGDVDAISKGLLRVKVREKKQRRRLCPQTKPVLQFLGLVADRSGGRPMHWIQFGDTESRRTTAAKPKGASELELFVDLVPPDEPIPTWPGERLGGRTWYLRGYTRSPVAVDFPACLEPMRVCYWGRWADRTGAFGPYSNTLVTRVEGLGMQKNLPASPIPSERRQTIIITSAVKRLPDLASGGAGAMRQIEDARRMLEDEEAEAA